MTDYYVEEEYEGGFEDDADLYQPDGDSESETDRRKSRSLEIEGRTTWMYLGFLSGLFLLLVVFSWACNDRSSTPTDLMPTQGEEAASSVGAASRINVNVSGNIATVSGSVPDEAAREQILAAAREAYGAENVIDELTIDPGSTLEGGSVSVTGSAEVDDGRPQAVQDAIVAALGVQVGEFSIERGSAQVGPVQMQALLDGGAVVLSGTVPDETSINDLIAAGEAVWGSGMVDVSGVTVGDSTWTEGVVILTGTTAPGDQRYEAVPAEIRSRFGNLVEIDVSGVEVSSDPDALVELEAEIAAALSQQPITFAPVSADIEPESDEVLATIAERLMAVQGVSIEVVGHTDDQGDEQENLLLSQQRAEAVVARLVELGVDETTLIARGEGEATPIADNNTADGRAQNRRIEFILAGAAN